MKKVASIAILFFALAFMLTACNTESGKKDSAPKKISVVATIYPQYDWLKNVIGERADAVDLKLLIKNGTDLHSYKPSAKDIATIAKADLASWNEALHQWQTDNGDYTMQVGRNSRDIVKKEKVTL
jgi:zinc transport system substrate-binding protein